MTKCTAIIDMQRPVGRTSTGRGRHWRVVFLYRCPQCTSEHRLLANTYIGFKPRRAVASVGGFICGRELPLPVKE